MDLKPKNSTSTINFSKPVQAVPLESKVVKDPEGIISNGIYKVIKWERFRQMIVIWISLAFIVAMGIIISLYATVIQTSWIGFVLPISILLYSLYKLGSTLIDRSGLKRGVEKYKEDLRIGISSHPPFIIRMYRRLHEKQISHNWLTFFLLLNGGVFTLALWGLKDVHWWIFRFDVWIRALFHNPDVMQWILTFALIAIAIIHIYFAIQRKRRIMEIDSYFGADVIPLSDLEALKTSRNKAYRRLFIIYIMIVLIIPLLVKLVLKVMRRK